MATLAAPRLPLDRHEPAPGEDRRALRGWAWGTAALAGWAFALNGYHPYAEDGGLYVAGVKRLLDPALFPRGTEFVLEPGRYSAFAWVVAGLVRAVGRLAGGDAGAVLPWVLVGLHLGTVWATLFAGSLLARRLFPARRRAQAGAVLLLACWLG
ncbi:MAG: hypothetical protein M3O02_03000, partial [Acidobacteriota bacterium]|nr:hypothetical protein [Acidobacteriota bacterium]